MKSKLFLATFVMCILLAGGTASHAATATQAATGNYHTAYHSKAKAKVVNHRRKRSKLRKAAMNVKKEKAIATERASNATAKGTRKGRKATARDVKKAGGELKKVAKK